MKESPIMTSLDINGILKHQRNRYPVLLIDQIIAVEPGKFATGVKCFTYNEWFFPGHFDDEPNVPGFIQIECLVQTFIMTFLCMEDYKGMKTNFVSANNVKFKRKIVPGEVLTVEATLQSFKRGLATGSVTSSVNGEAACSADFVIAVPDVFSRFKPKSALEEF
jgi:3-hydroxyacyl-[acyl-carrier-protein] dehydratase